MSRHRARVRRLEQAIGVGREHAVTWEELDARTRELAASGLDPEDARFQAVAEALIAATGKPLLEALWA